MYHELYSDSMPVGFGMTLAQDRDALNRFSLLTDKQRTQLLAKARGVESADEMRELVRGLANGQLL